MTLFDFLSKLTPRERIVYMSLVALFAIVGSPDCPQGVV